MTSNLQSADNTLQSAETKVKNLCCLLKIDITVDINENEHILF